MSSTILEICQQGISDWQKAFNRQDAAGCAAQYAENTIMLAKPFGEFKGRQAIESFWQGIMDKGFKDVDYTHVTWEAMGDDGYILTAHWTMNSAFGVVHHEHWQIQADGKARLAYDEFEVQGER
ncbi:YybH family protein [Shewanella sp. MF05960]|uniref:YybH family protein n=1 Tax=Shewanella sp. MF05960 TaxID=3434874 RepID=UPI003D7A5FBA